MGYLNPIASYGPERFCADAARAGVDGLIIVDLPTEEARMVAPHATTHGLDIIRLVAPTTDEDRLPIVLEGSSGFVYYVAITGITGTSSATAESLAAALPRIRRGHRPADRHRLRHPLTTGGRRGGAGGRCGRGGLLALVDTLAGSLDAQGRAVARHRGQRVLDQVRALAAGRPRTPRVDGMSWLNEYVRPKIRTLLGRREVPDNLWIQCPNPASRCCSPRTWTAISRSAPRLRPSHAGHRAWSV